MHTEEHRFTQSEIDNDEDDEDDEDDKLHDV